ncbi:recombinase XerD [Alteribacter lacisalsi]|uniref:Recombinase XerD n=1 Tax=Alteribacter lacisalsi TaxID=2045244 RepID=A0A2W0HQE5_9BACI|nr:tyrosine-type recombinase/integrase [Alteribacter lacisalsi]PYZ99099.1 recombinase XerD [Alteribacter lacisalsi]
MVRRSNNLTDKELTVVRDKTRNYVESFEEAMSIFEQNCELRNLRPDTVKYYRREVSAFLNILTEQGIDLERFKPSDVTEEHIKMNLILYMKNYRGCKPVTINTRLRALRAFYKFLYSQKLIPTNPMKNIQMMKDRKRVIPTFTKEELNKLLKQPDLTTFTGYRDYTLMMLFLETGIRVNEMTGLSIADIRWEDNLVCIRNAKSYRERLVPIQKVMKQQLKKYIAVRGAVSTDSLFITIDGTPLTRRGIQVRVEKYGRLAGIKGVRCSCHTFRHTFAKLSVQQGANIFELQTILGHTSMEIVKTYVNLFGVDVREKHKTFSPLKMLERRNT